MGDNELGHSARSRKMDWIWLKSTYIYFYIESNVDP